MVAEQARQKSANGWAVLHHDKVLVDTVSTYRRAAMVTWLVVYARIAVTNDWPDERVEKNWKAYGPQEGYCLAAVSVLPVLE